MTSEKTFVVEIDYDQDPECPTDWDGSWTLISFNTRHKSYRNPLDFLSSEINNETGVPDILDEEMKEKYEKGLLFFLSYFEHGQCVWSLKNELPVGCNCCFDSVRVAGIVVWENDEEELGPKTIEERKEDARNFLKIYTQWCNGEIYGYRAYLKSFCDHCDNEIQEERDSCWGFYSKEDMIDNLDLSDLPKDIEIEVVGKASFFLDEKDIRKALT